MFNLLNDGDRLVVRNSLSGFISIAEYFSSCFYKHANVRDIILVLLNLMKSTDDLIVESSLNVIRFITEGLVQNKDDQSLISSDPRILLEPMVSYFENKL